MSATVELPASGKQRGRLEELLAARSTAASLQTAHLPTAAADARGKLSVKAVIGNAAMVAAEEIDIPQSAALQLNALEVHCAPYAMYLFLKSSMRAETRWGLAPIRTPIRMRKHIASAHNGILMKWSNSFGGLYFETN